MRVQLVPLFSAGECEAVIAEVERQGFEAMGARYPAGYRNNDRAVRDDPALADRLFERLRGALPPRWNGWTLDGLNPRFRYCRYRDGQQFTKHRDGAWAAGASRSWLTVMVYLNEGFTGGATRFYPGDAVSPRAGHAVVFEHAHWHDGAPVTEGTKYVMRTDVMYRRPESVGRAPLREGTLTRARVIAVHDGYVWVVRQAADGSVLSGSRDGTVRRNGVVVRQGAGSVTALAEVNGAIWTGGRDGTLGDGRRRWAAHDGAVLSLAGADDGSVLSTSADGTVRRWSPTGEAMGVVSRHAGWVWGRGAVEPITCAAGEARGQRSGVLEVGARRWQAHDGAVTCVAALGDGWVTGGEDGAVRVWSGDGALRAEGWHADFVRSVAVLGAGRFATGSYDGTVVAWAVTEAP